ncbi:HIT family protein [Isobaculum melis]|uniref:Bis(5'-nucleosidyl)-tetraphosphatase n=1 Tax=Isobaculum melis TaxID=142588 RepID=A0A1H9TCK5_9LACT|nr:bis(5'-nucleosidyl)-tetraphosphatase [Isobaculum melis]
MVDCIFCTKIKSKDILVETENYFVVLDTDPIQVGHLLIISKKHYKNMIEIPEHELLELIKLEKKIMTIFEEKFNVLGVSIIQNNGKVMETGTHFHAHLIPRYSHDNFWDNQKVVHSILDITLLKKELQK